ncbi:hypothetical protein SAY86_025710 [Trapa natans]|uniref:Uncharacterized protein n=1 Tax=Trapa natans TaxID=22666 RepID=A0AAN7KKH4_TRANT|nr:hypothetical protein SAY86_025710 [Trapa natans]
MSFLRNGDRAAHLRRLLSPSRRRIHPEALPACQRCNSPATELSIAPSRRRSWAGKVRIASWRGLVCAMSSQNPSFRMNLNEYMVPLEKPLGIRLALSSDGKIFIHDLKRGGNAEKWRIIMVGDTLKKGSDSSGGQLFEIKDITDTG